LLLFRDVDEALLGLLDSSYPSPLVGWSKLDDFGELCFAPESVSGVQEVWLLMEFLDYCVDRCSDAGGFFVVALVELFVSGFPYC